MLVLHLLLMALCTLLLDPAASRAERLSIAPLQIWESWSYPAGALHLDAAGALRPVLISKDINPLAGAAIRGAVAALATAERVFDGDPTTGWSPPTDTPTENWWLEIDLGQVYPVQNIRLHFAETAPALGFFTLSLSKGERFAFNDLHQIAIDLDDELVQVIRIEATRTIEGTPILTEITADAFGDNIAFDLIANGGSVDVEAAIVAVAGSPSVMFDGNLSTMWRVNPLVKGSSGSGATFGDYRVDLGATYWIDSV